MYVVELNNGNQGVFMSTARTKRIFISDIHMGDERSVNPPAGKSYVWLKADRAGHLSTFLDTIAHAPDIKQVVILGDLFDEWLALPTDVPLKPVDLDKIITAPQNINLVKSLRKLAQSEIDLIYVPGNHDMLVSEELLVQAFPGINYMRSGPGAGVFKEDDIAAEHGNQYCLLNAPDVTTVKGSTLPLGYYLTRVLAKYTSNTGKLERLTDILPHMIPNLIETQNLIQSIFESYYDTAEMSDDSPILMDGLDNIEGSITVKEVSERYSRLLRDWDKNHDEITAFTAFMSEAGQLELAANEHYFQEKRARIVIFGHTHKAMLSNALIDLNPFDDEEREPQETIYANTGTWINGSPCTFVETEIVGDRHYVRLKEYKEDRSVLDKSEMFLDL